jgi:phosphatidyl-myo-inositol dimannoside synthase
MNVLILAPKYRGIGGAESYTRFLTRAVAGSGGEVDVLSLLEGEGAADQPVPGRYLGHQGTRPTPWAYARLAGEAMRRGRGYDLVICGHVAVAPIGMALRRIFRIPYICLAHGIDVWGHLGWARRAALRGAARIIAVSEFTARMLTTAQGVSPDRISVVYPPVDPALLALAGRTGTRTGGRPVTLLTVARLSAQERYKGCDTVIRALPSILGNAGALRYVIVGDGDDRPRLEALAERTGVITMVTFRGRVTREELADHYQSSDIFVMPSVAQRRPNGWTGEGFGIVYIEAAAFGCPVVAGSGGGAPEAVQDGITGCLVDGTDVAAVAGALLRLAGDEALRARMGEAGRRWVRERFTFERFERDVEEAVAALTGR